MNVHSRHLFTKFILIMIAEGLAMLATDTFSKHVFQIQHTTVTYVLCGAFMAVAVVTLYDRWMCNRQNKLKRELKDITDVALMRYNDKDE
jgi:hypothetical protein